MESLTVFQFYYNENWQFVEVCFLKIYKSITREDSDNRGLAIKSGERGARNPGLEKPRGQVL